MTLPNPSITKIACLLRTGLVVVLIAAVAGSALPALAQKNMSVDQIKRKLENDFGVTVLRTEEITGRDGSILAVTIMNPSGDFNEALQVNTLAVDPKTGNLVSQYRQTPNGMRFAAPSIYFRTSPRTAENR